jgi:hypothetical protein
MQTITSVCFSWSEINPYDGIPNLQPPDFTTLLTTMNGEGYLIKAAWRHGSIAHLQDNAFSTLLQYMNNLEQHIVEDVPYDKLIVLLKGCCLEEWYTCGCH